jgi:Homeodomain-like domain
VRRGVGEQEVRPRRGRCGGCGRTHVLLPEFCLLRRRDAVDVIGAALVAKAQGVGYRRIAGDLGVPAETVRGWLRRFGALVERVRVHFWGWAHALDASLAALEPSGTPLGDAVAAIGAATRAAVLRLGLRQVWAWVSAMTGGRLLSNTSCPWPAP